MIKYLLAFYVMLVFASWFITFKSEDYYDTTLEKDLTWYEADKGWTNVSPSKIYTEKQDVSLLKTKTLIPFVYHTDTLKKSSVQLYSRDR